ncbi:MAG TPA: hypothetical protein VKE22_19035 [Haliangiales bacterium]|nr:hypothetical protein [Haliangiales bacterium]
MRRAWLLLLVACRDELPKAELVNDLRILAMRAEPAEAAAGDTVAIDALVVQPDPPGPTERVWLACVTAQNGPATGCLAPTLPPPCDVAPEARACVLGTGETASWRLPSIATVQGFVTLATAMTNDGGIAGCAQALASGGVVPDYCRVAVKRIPILRAGETPNHNPRLDGLAIDGEHLAVALAPDAVEAGENPFLSWFVTAGEVDHFRTDANGAGLTNLWTPASQAGRVWVVIRDGRGGESWIEGER